MTATQSAERGSLGSADLPREVPDDVGSEQHLPVDPEGRSGLQVTEWVWHRRVPIVTVAAVAGAAYLGLVAIWWAASPAEVISTQQLRFAFKGAERGEYPSGAEFRSADLANPQVLAAVHSTASLERWVSLDEFCAAVTVSSGGFELVLLQSDYQARLTNSKLTQVERTAVEAEYRRLAEALPRDKSCLHLSLMKWGVPLEVQERALAMIPPAWARFAAEAHGAGQYDIAIPSTLSEASLDESGSLEQAEQIKFASQNLGEAVRSLLKLPNAGLVKDSHGRGLRDLEIEVTAHFRGAVLPRYLELLRFVVAEDPSSAIDAFECRLADRRRELGLLQAGSLSLQHATRDYMGLEVNGNSALEERPIASPDGTIAPPAVLNFSSDFLDRVIAQGVRSSDLEYRRELFDKSMALAAPMAECQTDLEFDEWAFDYSRRPAADATGIGPVMPERSAGVTQIVAKRLGDLSKRAQEFLHQLANRNLNPAADLYVPLGPVLSVRSGKLPVERLVGGLASVEALAVAATLLWLVTKHQGGANRPLSP